LSSSVEKLILKIVNENPKPIPQSGEIVEFKRLRPAESELDFSLIPEELFDRIRMVDGLDYPKAFLKIGKYKIEFSNALMKDGKLSANVEFNEE